MIVHIPTMPAEENSSLISQHATGWFGIDNNSVRYYRYNMDFGPHIMSSAVLGFVEIECVWGILDAYS